MPKMRFCGMIIGRSRRRRTEHRARTHDRSSTDMMTGGIE